MAMDPRKRKKILVTVGGLAGAVVLIIVMYLLVFSGSSKPVKRESLGGSDSMAPVQPTAVVSTPGTVTIEPASIAFNPDQPADVQIKITANGGAVGVKDLLIPTQDATVIKATNLDCPAYPMRIAAGKSCIAVIHWTGDRTVNSIMHFRGETAGAMDPTNPGNITVKDVLKDVAVTGVSTRPPGSTIAGAGAPGEGGQGAPGAPGSIPAPSGPGAAQVGAIPQQAAQIAPQGPSVREQYQGAYLDARRGGGLQGVQPQGGAAGQLQAAARSPYVSWDNIGIKADYSSLPVDMSHVITPDKPLPAVLVNAIDTRATVTAVGMVDRDVYGNNGRTVIVPRGTKIIGTIEVSTERVGITWTQLIRPDGTRFVFAAATGDAMGRGGVPGRINERNLQRYGYTLLGGLVTAGSTAAIGGQQTQTASSVGGATQTQDSKAIASAQLTQSINTISSDYFGRKKNLPIQITVPAGTRITIWSQNDLRLKPAYEDDNPKNASGTLAAQTGAAQSTAPFAGGKAGALSGFKPTVPTQQQAPASNGQTGQTGGSAVTPSGSGTGQIDANGNYVAPGAPSPGPRLLNSGSTNSTSSASSTQAPWNK